MKTWTLGLLLLVVVVAAGGCSQEPQDANANPNPEAAEMSSATPAPAPAPASAPAAAAPPAAAPDRTTPAPAAPAAPAPARAIQVPSGTQFEVVLLDPLSSATNKAGDEFMATMAEPLVIAGRTVIDKGTQVRGRVIDAEGSGRVRGVASMRLALTAVMPNDRAIPIVTQAHYTEAEATKGRDAAIIGGAAGIGAAIGAIAGGKQGAGTGAAIGGAAGTGTVLATKGQEVEFPTESRLAFTLDQAVSIPGR